MRAGQPLRVLMDLFHILFMRGQDSENVTAGATLNVTIT
jgi:hypothetical protein